jgi:hypothetical protein
LNFCENIGYQKLGTRHSIKLGGSMKKRIVVVLMVVVMMMATSVSALAVEGSPDELDFDIQALLEDANEVIDELIIQAQEDADHADLSNKDLMKIIVKLKQDTKEISKITIKEARDNGCKDVRCYFVEVEIGDKIVKIDPLVVGGW